MTCPLSSMGELNVTTVDDVSRVVLLSSLFGFGEDVVVGNGVADAAG